MMRALVLDHQNDENVYEIGDQYLFGQQLMVCPVTTKGAQTRSVYLPEGEWYDWWTGKKYSGKQYVHVLTPLDSMPLFAKAGAIIPMQPFMNYVGEKAVDTITLDVFPGNGSFTLYEDDGESLNYQQGNFSTTTISVSGSKITIGKPEGTFKPTARNYLIKFRASAKPRSVTVNNWWYDEKEKVLYVPISSDNSKEIIINH